MSGWHEDVLRHKYAPLPEEGPRHRKRAKKAHVRSDHRHEYEDVCVDAHTYTVTREGRFPAYYVAERCRICGRVGDVRGCRNHEPPDGMRLFEVRDLIALLGAKFITEDKEVDA